MSTVKPTLCVIGKGYWGSKIINYVDEYFNCVHHIGNDPALIAKIMADKTIENIMVVTPIETHYELCKTALENGKNVFCEKPITLHVDEAIELKELAEKNNLKLGVEYTHTFSDAIHNIATECVLKYGPVEYYEMNSKHLGRFMEHNVYWLLASHFLAVLDLFIDIDKTEFRPIDRMYYKGICTTGTLEFDKGRIETSINYTDKDSSIVFYFKNATITYSPLSTPDKSFTIVEYNNKYKALPPELTDKVIQVHSDERHNLKNAVRYFSNLIKGKADTNIKTAVEITRILEGT